MNMLLLKRSIADEGDNPLGCGRPSVDLLEASAREKGVGFMSRAFISIPLGQSAASDRLEKLRRFPNGR